MGENGGGQNVNLIANAEALNANTRASLERTSVCDLDNVGVG
jgi:hypothetical protein